MDAKLEKDAMDLLDLILIFREPSKVVSALKKIMEVSINHKIGHGCSVFLNKEDGSFIVTDLINSDAEEYYDNFYDDFQDDYDPYEDQDQYDMYEDQYDPYEDQYDPYEDQDQYDLYEDDYDPYEDEDQYDPYEDQYDSYEDQYDPYEDDYDPYEDQDQYDLYEDDYDPYEDEDQYDPYEDQYDSYEDQYDPYEDDYDPYEDQDQYDLYEDDYDPYEDEDQYDPYEDQYDPYKDDYNLHQDDYDPFGKRTIGNGNITLFEKDILGKGSNGAVVLGTFANRTVAVKIINVPLSVDSKIGLPEKEILLQCDDHENIVKYFGEEIEFCSYANQARVFLAIELCQLTLREWIENQNESIKKLGIRDDAFIQPLDILFQITKGLAHLHQRRRPIVHRDLKPENILFQKMTNDSVRVKLSDFGISCIIAEGQTHVTLVTASGTTGWIAPEILEGRFNPELQAKMTKQSDIFSLGCVYYYVLTNGDQLLPGQCLNFADHTPKISNDKFIDASYHNCKRLISLMTSRDPRRRPTVTSILNHHLFWSTDKSLQFISDASSLCNSLEWSGIEAWVKVNYHQVTDEKVFHEIFSESGYANGWVELLSPEVQKAICTKKTKAIMQYKSKSIRDLIRAIRNLKEHYNQQQEDVKENLGSLPDNFLQYWMNRFPCLVDLIWTAVQNQNISQLYRYYENIDFNFSCV